MSYSTLRVTFDSHWGTSNFRNVSYRNIPRDTIVNKNYVCDNTFFIKIMFIAFILRNLRILEKYIFNVFFLYYP